MTRADRGLPVRWVIAFLLSAAIAISYFDRQTLGVAVKAIRESIPTELLPENDAR
jgi:MFS transporter, ACS family, hexuronate transporter